MATAADGGAYEGGAGGKLRRKPLRRAVAATPYDRPPNAIRNSVSISGFEADSNNNNGWLLKIVDPASRIITRGAQRLFSSVFRKRLPAPETTPRPTTTVVSVETNHEPQTRDEFRAAASFNPSGAQEKVSNEVNRPTDNSDADSINELEKILKQKTFTREEIDRLTDLLRSRTVDVEGHQKQKIEPNTLQPVILKENRAKMQSFVEEISAPVVSSSVLQEDVASPAELAKAYMGKRSSRIAPSPLGLRSQPLRDDVISLCNAPFSAKSPCMALAPRSAVRFANVPGVSENSYVTPIRRGRSAIYNMARTPYSRSINHNAFKGVESAVDANVGPSSPQWWSWENNDHSGAKQVSKRRSSVLDSDIGSVGPIRRIRRKTNMVSPSKSASLVTSRTALSSPATAMCTDVAQVSTSSNWNLLLLDEPKHNTSSHKLVENLNKNTPDVGFASVPSQSNEMARRILQQLDKLVPSPKEKSSELKLATGTGKAPTKLTPGMLHGQALRSMEAVDSSKLLHNIQGIDSVNGLGGARLAGSQDSSPQAQVRVQENGPSKVSSMGVKWASETNGIAVKSFKETADSVDADSVISNIASNLPQKKRGFQISAHEDSLEFDDIPDKEKPDSSVTERKTYADSIETVEKHGISSFGSLPVAISTSKAMKDMGTSELLLPAARKDTGFAFSNTRAPSAISELAVPTSEPPPLFNGPAPTKEPTTAPVFSFGSKGFNSPAPLTFSSTSATNESLSFKLGGHEDSKLETSISAATPAAKMTETTSIAAEVDKGNNDKSQEAGNLPKQEDAVPSSSLPSATPLFSFGGSMSNSTPEKESFSSSASLISAPSASAITSGSASNSIFSVPAISAIPSGATNTIFSSASAGASTAETTSSIVSTPTSSTFSPVPTFHFGSSTSAAAPSVSAPLHSATSGVDSAGPGLKAKEVSSFGSLSSSSFGATSSAFAGMGSGIFAFGASAPSTTSTTSSTSSASNPFQSSNTANAASSGSASFSQAVPRTGNSLFTQSMPMQFGSPAFGSSGSSPFSSGSALFSSSSTGCNLFGTVSSFSTGSSLNSTGTSSFNFTAGTGSSISSSSTQSTTSLIFGSSTPTAGFSFGSSSTTAGTGGALPFGSALSGPSGSIFSFNSAASTSSAPLSPTFSSFGSTAPAATIGTASPSNDQMNMEDSMAEDTIQAAPSPLVGPAFGQPANSPAPNFAFGSPAPSGPPLFQFGSQPSPLTPQNPFASTTPSNLDFAAGGSFSLGTGGGDKANRKIIKVNRTKLRKR